MSPHIFRLLLVVSVVTGLMGAAFDVLVPSALPESFSSVQSAFDNAIPMSLSALLLGCAYVLGTLVAWLGLLTFRNWAPHLAVVFTALGIIITPMLGPSVSSGWTMALFELSSTLWAVALAAAYLSPLKERFFEPTR